MGLDYNLDDLVNIYNLNNASLAKRILKRLKLFLRM